MFVMALGFGKAYLDGRKLEKLKRAEETKARAKRRRQNSYGRLSISSSDIPFGSRCIEKGVEVEGIWISRPNSVLEPDAASPHATPPSSPPAVSRFQHSYRGSPSPPISSITKVDVADTPCKREEQ